MLPGLIISLALLASPPAEVPGASDGSKSKPADTPKSSDAPETGCILQGKVLYTRAGKPASPKGQVVVFVENFRETEVQKKQGEPKTLKQIGMHFDQQVMVLQRHEKIIVRNEDNQDHNVFGTRQFENPFPPKPVSKGDITADASFWKPGHSRIQCDIHGWMRTDVLVLKNHAYDRIANDEGGFRIAGLPRGQKYKVVAWEPNGARLEVGEFLCDGPTVVPPFTLTGEKEPVLRRYDNLPYEGEYARDRAPPRPSSFIPEQ